MDIGINLQERRNVSKEKQFEEDRENLSQSLRNWSGNAEMYEYLLKRLKELKDLKKQIDEE